MKMRKRFCLAAPLYLAALAHAGPESLIACHVNPYMDTRMSILLQKIPFGMGPLNPSQNELSDTTRANAKEKAAITLWIENRNDCSRQEREQHGKDWKHPQPPLTTFMALESRLDRLLIQLAGGRITFGEFNRQHKKIDITLQEILPDAEAAIGALPSPRPPNLPPLDPALDATLEQTLLANMRWDRRKNERDGDSATAIHAYQRAGAIRRHPNGRLDYSDEYLLKRRAHLLGNELVGLEEDTMDQYIGCCINPGITATLRLTGRDNSLKTFATENNCELREDLKPGIFAILYKGVPKARYAELRCHSE